MTVAVLGLVLLVPFSPPAAAQDVGVEDCTTFDCPIELVVVGESEPDIELVVTGERYDPAPIPSAPPGPSLLASGQAPPATGSGALPDSQVPPGMEKATYDDLRLALAEELIADWPELGTLVESTDPNCKGLVGERSEGRTPSLDETRQFGGPESIEVTTYLGFTNRVYVTKCLGDQTVSGLKARADRDGNTCTQTSGVGAASGVVTGIASKAPPLRIGGVIVGLGSAGYGFWCNQNVEKIKNTANFIDNALKGCGGRGIAFDVNYTRLQDLSNVAVKDVGVLDLTLSRAWCQQEGDIPANPVPKGPFG